ncbi:MAG TPA: type I DNA topoisomerase [Planctomycetaceae bacterium]|nr:type I DNA topoisomerase [Planctomycetaceae bacterium]
MGTKKAKGAEQRSRSEGEGGNGGALKAQGRGSRPSLVIVESPAKARKIGGFLGKNYSVMASMGHVRDLPANASEVPEEIKKQKKPWASLGVDVEHDFEPVYVIPKDKRKTVTQLKAALKDASELILATDEDREGESIGWHLSQLLKPKVPVKRMVFSEITKEAIQHAIQQTRALDEKLVEAQETRRVLDRLYGYTLSPLLWKKIARGLSAGRVQSVAVRLLVQRELERMAFHSATYWDLKARLITPQPESSEAAAEEREFEATLAAVGGRRVATGKDFDESTGKLKPSADVVLLSESDSTSLRDRAAAGPWKVTDVEQRPQVRRPSPPFTTSTLQQEANRKLGYSAKDTMRVAQRLYEDGYITYMRTDSVQLSREAITAVRKCVRERYGDTYLEASERSYTTKSRNAQEAHEAIRPAGTEMHTAEELSLAGREAELYAMIWKRTVASQMVDAQLLFQTVTITSGEAEFRATGRHIEFPGYFRAYVEGVDDPEAAMDDQESALPPLSVESRLACRLLEAVSHETKPPARFTDASLVRTLEAEGIGRPSTYASIISTIQDRGYVRKSGNQLVPTFTALAVTKLLEKYFPRLVDLGFTAKMEQTLDDISNGEAERLPYLTNFYAGSEGLVEQVKAKEESIDPREACSLRISGLEPVIRVGRFGPFFEQETDGKRLTVSIPNDVAPADISADVAAKLIEEKKRGSEPLALDPETGEPIYVMAGPYGPYLQLGDVKEEGPKPRRTSIPKGTDPATISIEKAVKLLSLPRTLGNHPESGKPVKAGIGRFGPYVVHEGVFKSFGKDGTFEHNGRRYDVLDVDLETAIEMLKQARKRASATPVRELGKHPEDGSPVAIFEGKYGPFVRYGSVNVTIPKGTTVEEVKIEQVAQWAADKAARGGPARGRRAPRRTKAATNGQKTQPPASTEEAASPKRSAATKKSAAAKSVARTKSSAAVPKTSAAKSPSARKTAAAKKKSRRSDDKRK